MAKQQFILTIPTKPYVKHWLQIFYGQPANFTRTKELYQLIQNALAKPKHKNQKRIKPIAGRVATEVIIQSDDFYRLGWELTETDTRRIAYIMEQKVKEFMRVEVNKGRKHMLSKKEAIIEFQNFYGFTEDIWSWESIRRHYDRIEAHEQKQAFINHIQNKSLAILSSERTHVPSQSNPT